MTSTAARLIYKAKRLPQNVTASVKALRSLPGESISLRKPKLWPGPNGSKTTVKAFYDGEGLHALFSVFGAFKAPSGSTKESILNDDRVEIFAFPVGSTTTYRAYETNRGAKTFDFGARVCSDCVCDSCCGAEAKFVRRFDYKWSGNLVAEFVAADGDSDNKAAAAESKSASASSGAQNGAGKDADVLAGYMRMSVPWSDLNVDASKALPKQGIVLGFYRGETFVNDKGETDWIWTNWVDPGVDAINFHCPETFGEVHLVDEVAE